MENQIEHQEEGVEYWHILNRGVDKREIVLDDKDRARFIHNLFVFNDARAVLHSNQATRFDDKDARARELLVHIHAFCLMGNHYHLLVNEVKDGGIALFMQKMNMGYTKYFNKKYARTGTLWQGKYKMIHIARDAHFLYIPFYIHLNPLDFVMPEWREGRVTNTTKALAHLESYRWSSHLDYLGKKNFSSITHREKLSDILGGRERYLNEMVEIIKDEEIAEDSYRIEV